MTPTASGTSSTEGDGWRRRRERMVERQLRRRGIGDERVLAAMSTVAREQFVRSPWRHRAYRDGPLPIGSGQTISQPLVVAHMASLLELDGDERVLDVGTGSGYAAAVLSRCCAEVVSVERIRGLAEAAAERLAGLGYDNIEVRVGDGNLGAPDRAPFGGIAVAATARDHPPAALLGQLAPGAALVCPVRRGEERLVRVRAGGEEEAIAPVRFVPLLEGTE